MLSEMGSLWRVLGNGMISDFHFDIIIILAACVGNELVVEGAGAKVGLATGLLL